MVTFVPRLTLHLLVIAGYLFALAQLTTFPVTSVFATMCLGVAVGSAVGGHRVACRRLA